MVHLSLSRAGIVCLLALVSLSCAASAAAIGGNQGWYVVHCNVDGANVYFDNTYAGVITAGVLNVPVYTTGTPYKTYTVSMPGYTTYTASVQRVPGNGESIELYATLNPVQPTVAPVIGGSQGWYQVNCNVNGAQVTFDNQVVGTIVNGVLTVPVYTTGTPYKTYTVSTPGYVSYTAPITTFPASGETVQLYATLNPQPPTATPTPAPTKSPIGFEIVFGALSIVGACGIIFRRN